MIAVKTLIIEPSDIVCQGLKAVLKQLPINNTVQCFRSFEAFAEEEIAPESIDLVLLNPVVCSHCSQVFHRLSIRFGNAPLIGLASGVYELDFCKQLDDCIYLTDEAGHIINTIHKHLENKKEKHNEENHQLSDREVDVVKLMVKGKSNKEIAEELFISIHTVVSHRKNISAKLGIKTPAAIAIYAVAKGLISIDDAMSGGI